MTEYETVIGLEVHAEMLTNSKMFCGCPVVDPTLSEPNTAVCPICTAQPGALPVVNEEAIRYGIMVGLALNCRINPLHVFARKSYFYPDLPKGYQISQYDFPLASDGYLDIMTENGPKRIGITRAHLEEDAGKLTHAGHSSLVDLNRAGVPLLEIVSEPDMRSVEEAEAYARKLRAIIVTLGVNHGDMSKGVLRFEANISVRPTGETELRTRTEIKNLNSIRSLVRASRYEIDRQIAAYERRESIQAQTMGFDEEKGVTFTQRIKETADDYRYFPEPDIPPLKVTQALIETIRAGLPELPEAKSARYQADYQLAETLANILVSDGAVAHFFESAVAAGGADPEKIANWLITEVFRLANSHERNLEESALQPDHLVALLKLVDAGTVNNTTAKVILEELFLSGGEPDEIIRRRGLAQISDANALTAVIAQILDTHPAEVALYHAGKETVLSFLVGQVMRETRGKANAALVNELLREMLDI